MEINQLDETPKCIKCGRDLPYSKICCQHLAIFKSDNDGPYCPECRKPKKQFDSRVSAYFSYLNFTD